MIAIPPNYFPLLLKLRQLMSERKWGPAYAALNQLEVELGITR